MQDIKMRGISKEFNGKWALQDIDLDIKAGMIHAIVGENGAGKSTLMSILSGALPPTSGTITMNGKTVVFKNPQDASAMGIGMVYQHFMLIPALRVWQNAVLGMEPIKKNGTIHKRAALQMLEKACKDYQISLDLEQVVGSLTVGEQQRIEILKVMIRNAEVIIFDEPTSVLTPGEIKNLLENFRIFKSLGKTIVFISHKLEEVMQIADEITIIRRGKKICTLPQEEANADNLVEMMVGRQIKMETRPVPSTPGEDILKVSGLCVERTRFSCGLDQISFSLRKGEVLGFAGIDGNGQLELIEVIFGLRPIAAGSIQKDGQELASLSSTKIRRHGIACIPPDRQLQGLVLDSSVSRNLLLGCEDNKKLGSGATFTRKSIARLCSGLAEEYDVRMPSLDALASDLSGGNQQKIIIAREFGVREFDLIVAMNPTRGLDIGAVEFVHQVIEEQKQQGKAVLLISTELTEILRLSDRIAVLFKGRIVGLLNRIDADIETLGQFMAGITDKKEENCVTQ